MILSFFHRLIYSPLNVWNKSLLASSFIKNNNFFAGIINMELLMFLSQRYGKILDKYLRVSSKVYAEVY